jgi:CRP-like cAMP-binding protein
MERKLIEGIHLFDELNASEKDELMPLLEFRDYQAGQEVYHEGEKGDNLNMIITGKIRINKMTVEGDQFTIATLKAGDIFGIMSFLDGSRHDASITAEKAATIVVLKKSDFDALMEKKTHAAAKILKGLAVHLSGIVRKMNSQYMDLMHLMCRSSK